MNGISLCFYGIQAEDIKWIKRTDGGGVDIKFDDKDNGLSARMFLRPKVVQAIAAMSEEPESEPDERAISAHDDGTVKFSSPSDPDEVPAA